TKLLLLTHCNNKTGLIIPVKDIVAIARPRGVDVVVDAAHSFGQVPLTVADLDADFVGLNLHKWIGAPVGAGAMYIRADKLDRIDRAHGDESAPMSRIDSRLHTGTANFAIIMTIADALDFQATIGVENKAARLRYLRDSWVNDARKISGMQILTPDDANLVGAITSFRMHGRTSAAENKAVAKTLLDEFGLFTVARNGLAKGDCVRVTPALYNSVGDAQKLVKALGVIAARG
ncbi:MAG: aminotransferase class V-fold PLP-dependent enzyme, partial [Gemmatimonadaceae bacterium]